MFIEDIVTMNRARKFFKATPVTVTGVNNAFNEYNSELGVH